MHNCNSNCKPNPVRPEGTTTITVNAPPMVKVLLSATAQQNSGGHSHDGSRPVGTFTKSSGTTDANGVFTTQYRASEIGGIEIIKAEIESGQSSLINLNVRISGLSELGSGLYYVLTGWTGTHPSNHWGTSGAISDLENIADDYHTAFPEASSLRYNDMSLERGGLFDIDGDWHTPHSEHRFGTNCDLSMSNVPVGNRTKLAEIIARYGSYINEVDHWHLRL